MSFDKQKRKEFRIRILRNELLSIGEQFHSTAVKWLKETKRHYVEDSAELKRHPNSILSDLKRINHERAYILYKIESLAKDKSLPAPIKLRKKLRKMEMEIQFQGEFPEEYQQFTEKLKHCLKTSPYSPGKKVKKSNDISLQCNIDLGEPTESMVQMTKSKKKSPSVNTMMALIRGHGVNAFKDAMGYFNPPTFTKAKLERMFGIWIPYQRFNQLKSKMNAKQKRQKHGNAKRAAAVRRERQQKLYNFQNPL